MIKPVNDSVRPPSPPPCTVRSRRSCSFRAEKPHFKLIFRDRSLYFRRENYLINQDIPRRDVSMDETALREVFLNYL